MAATKQNELVESLAKGVQAHLAPNFTRLAEDNAKLMARVGALEAQIECLVSALAARETAPAAKRAVRAAGGAPKASSARGGASKTSGVIGNAMLYLRYIMAKDIDNARSIYGTPENIQAAENDTEDTSVSKKDRSKNEEEYFSSLGNYVWRHILVQDEDKNEIRTQYNAYKERLSREIAQPPLEEEIVDDE